MNVIKKVLSLEPALVVGFIAGVAVSVQQLVAEGEPLTWKALLPIVVAAVIRQLVTPTAKAEAQVVLASKVYSPALIGAPHREPDVEDHQ